MEVAAVCALVGLLALCGTALKLFSMSLAYRRSELALAERKVDVAPLQELERRVRELESERKTLRNTR